jgi:THUMP domain-like/RNA cap guanine-N2 methyltransferase
VPNEDPSVLLSDPGQELLARIAAAHPGDVPGLAEATALRRVYPAGLVAAAVAQHELRLTARAKFSGAMQMLLTRGGYEQSTSEPIARHRARRFAGTGRAADLCCGIGGDLIALAAGREVLAVDRDPVHARLARHNAGVYGVADGVRLAVADVRDISLHGIGAVFIDPARRAGARGRGAAAGGATAAGPAGLQRFRAGTSEPPLEWCFELAARGATARNGTVRNGTVRNGAARNGTVRNGTARNARKVPAVCVKAAPGIDTSVIPQGWEAEFIADGRDLKEAVLWSPALATTSRRATIIAPGGPDAPAVVHALTPSPGPPVPVGPPGEFLYDPSPAVTRAGLVEDLARQLGAWKIDEQIAFLSTDEEAATPFARTLKVIDSAPWTEKRAKARLRELGVGAADLRRRGLAGDVDAIRRRLRLAGPYRATIVLTRVADRPWGLICADPGTPLAR